MRKIIRFFAGMTAIMVFSVLGLTAYYQATIPDHYYVHQGEQLTINSLVSSSQPQHMVSAVSSNQTLANSVQLDLFGLIPIKQTMVSEVKETEVIPGGTPFGVKLLTQGVMVVGLNAIDSEDGLKNPAKDAGLKIGDIITAVNGQPVSSNKEISAIVQQSNGAAITVTYTRGSESQTISIQPVISRVDKHPKAGIWVRDSSAGIGTVTFYDPNTQLFGGLGHPVCDVDTGMTLPISYGEVVPATISGINKGTIGTPGELIGAFTNNFPIGSVLLNTDCGVFGELYQQPQGEPVPLALKQEVHTGKATILSTLDGETPQEYEIEIEELNLNEKSVTRNMVIRVTDKTLLEKAGGIVQGMSGSPILQDGKLVGAVTHVFVNDPTKGYGIFAENMMSTALSLEQDQEQKAS